jgi:hypothetical protein
LLVSRFRLRSSSQIDTPAALSAANGSLISALVPSWHRLVGQVASCPDRGYRRYPFAAPERRLSVSDGR